MVNKQNATVRAKVGTNTRAPYRKERRKQVRTKVVTKTVAKMVERLLAKAALWVRILTYP
jgi:hypothetical protein